jgi:hypothetical protein
VTLQKSTLPVISLSTIVVLLAIGCGGSASKPMTGVAPAPAPSSPAPSSSASSGITVSTPADGATVGSPFSLSASASTCSSEPVTSIGYSFDGSSDTIGVGGSTVSTTLAAPAGTHTLHVKAWTSSGASCGQDLTLTVNGDMPGDAVVDSGLQTKGSWQAAHDPASGSASSGTTDITGSPSVSGNARQFKTSFTNYGGEIYSLVFDNDPDATNFFYDAWVYLTSSASNTESLEMDMNQVMENGQTVIYGFQCDGISGTWDYTANSGSLAKPVDEWVHSSAPCNVRNWALNQWHHVQIGYARNDSGNVTYQSVWLDGKQAQINATVPSVFVLNWAPALVTNFQVDGIGTGSNTVYLDGLTITHW